MTINIIINIIMNIIMNIYDKIKDIYLAVYEPVLIIFGFFIAYAIAFLIGSRNDQEEVKRKYIYDPTEESSYYKEDKEKWYNKKIIHNNGKAFPARTSRRMFRP